MDVTIEVWTVYRAWKGDHVDRWCLVFDGTPIGPQFLSREDAEVQARAWGWTVVEPARMEG